MFTALSKSISLFIVSALFLSFSQTTFAATYPQDFQETVYEDGLNVPTSMAFSPDGRLFVTEQGGKLRIIKNGQLLETPFLSLPVDTYIERGLLGIAFDPNFATNRYIYVYYTPTQAPAKNKVSRFTASAVNPDVVEANSEYVLIDNIPSDSGMHNGGALHFGTDGKLYVAIGDGGSTATNAQSLANLSGKILRLNTDGSIPSDNPFVGQQNARGEIWSYGLRNPFTFAIHPISGKMMINDVGANIWEEVNLGIAGSNYGWPTCEGSCNTQGLTNPIYQQYHPLMASITGASFYTGSTYPSDYKNYYFFGDYVKNIIQKLDYTNGNVVTDFAKDVPAPVDIDQGPDGNLYYVSITTGTVYKVQYNNNQPTPTPTSQVTPTPKPNSNPTAEITAPNDGYKFVAGDTVNYVGNANDAEDGVLPASAYSWKVIFHHDTHTHPYLGPVEGVKNGSFSFSQTGETASNVWYRIQLTVKDSNGATTTVYKDVYPKKSEIRLQTYPAGLQMTLDGQPITSPTQFTGVQGIIRTLDAPETQTVDGKTYAFVSWSDGKTKNHMIQTPNTDTIYTANYRLVQTTGNGLRGTYFDYTTFSGKTSQRIDPNIDFNWGTQAPIAGFGPNYYSVRWEGEIAIPQTGEYTFYTSSDDGVRLWINGTGVIDKWVNQSTTEHQGKITLEGGKKYKIRMDYYNAPVEGIAKLSWSSPSIEKQIVPQSVLYANPETAGDGLAASYFNTIDLTGNSINKIDSAVNFDWGISKPLDAIDADTFSVRWTGYVVPKYTQEYTFTAQSDDGVRVWINNQKLIDKWIDQSPTENEGKIALQANIRYPVTIEYYENEWGAVAKLLWQSESQTKQVIPQEQLFSW